MRNSNFTDAETEAYQHPEGGRVSQLNQVEDAAEDMKSQKRALSAGRFVSVALCVTILLVAAVVLPLTITAPLNRTSAAAGSTDKTPPTQEEEGYADEPPQGSPPEEPLCSSLPSNTTSFSVDSEGCLSFVDDGEEILRTVEVDFKWQPTKCSCFVTSKLSQLQFSRDLCEILSTGKCISLPDKSKEFESMQCNSGSPTNADSGRKVLIGGRNSTIWCNGDRLVIRPDRLGVHGTEVAVEAVLFLSSSGSMAVRPVESIADAESSLLFSTGIYGTVTVLEWDEEPCDGWYPCDGIDAFKRRYEDSAPNPYCLFRDIAEDELTLEAAIEEYHRICDDDP